MILAHLRVLVAVILAALMAAITDIIAKAEPKNTKNDAVTRCSAATR